MRLFSTGPLSTACLLFPLVATCQDPASTQTTREISSSETPFTFESKVNLVLVPVVVRDKNGKAVSSLQREDFQLRDRGRAQEILRFSVEHAAAPPRAIDSRETEPDRPSGNGASLIPPGRFVAYLFDDIHGDAGDLARSRAAAERNIQKTLSPSERIAVFTTSGSVSLDFTNDLAKVHEALGRITPHRSRTEDCPDENYYMADLVRNKNDLQTLALATAEAEQCLSLPVGPAQNVAINTAIRILATGDEDTRLTLDAVDRAIGALSSAPGQRILVLGTPGYLRLTDKMRVEARLIDRAIRNDVVIGAVDIRGLPTYTVDASVHTVSGQPTIIIERQKYERWSRLEESDSMTQLANSTGGTVIRNNNDLEGGFNRTGSSADVWYVLGFSPQNLSNDGTYHPLKVALRKGSSLNVEARPGYYAPTHAVSAEESARDEISEAIFSRTDEKTIPITVRTEFVKTSETEALMEVHANVDVRGIHYRMDGDRSVDQLRLAFTLFDRDGKLIEGASRKLDLRLRQETLKHRLDSGINVNVEFKAPPGVYVVRVVARDDEGHALGSRSKAVEIP